MIDMYLYDDVTTYPQIVNTSNLLTIPFTTPLLEAKLVLGQCTFLDPIHLKYKLKLYLLIHQLMK